MKTTVDLPLHKALMMNDAGGFLEALKNATPAQVNKKDEAGDTALHILFGMQFNDSERFKLMAELLSKGANPTMRNHQTKTPVDLAIGGEKEWLNKVIAESKKQQLIPAAYRSQPSTNPGRNPAAMHSPKPSTPEASITEPKFHPVAPPLVTPVG